MDTPKKTFIVPVLGIGFLIWFLATLAFRVAGQFFFITESPATLTVLYLAVLPVLAFISVATFRKFQLAGLETVFAGVLLVLPGMIIDTFVIQFFKDIFPNMPSSRAAAFGSWLMWAYAVVLVTSVVSGHLQKTTSDRS